MEITDTDILTSMNATSCQQDIQLTQNQAYVASGNIPVKPNESYGTTTTSMDSRLPFPPRLHQQQDMPLTQNQAYVTSGNIPMKTNESYGTTTTSMDSRLPFPPRLHQQQDMPLTQNQAYVTSGNIPMKTNESYGTTTTSMDSDQLYATCTVEEEHRTTHTYDYIIP